MLRSTFAAFLAFALFLLVHALHFHFYFPLDKATSVFSTALLSAVCFIIFYALLPTEATLQRKLHLNEKRMERWIFPLLGLLFYAFLFLGYLEFYFTADRSITFRMLMLIHKAPQHTMSQRQMLTSYDVPGIINKRFEDLVYGGYLKKEGDNYTLTPKGNLTLSVYRETIDFLHLNTGEKKHAATR